MLDTSIYSEEKLGNDNKVSVNGKGINAVYTKSCEIRTIDDVYYISSLKSNLLRIRQIMEKRYKLFFKNDVCIIIDKFPSNQLIERVEMTKNRMFPLTI